MSQNNNKSLGEVIKEVIVTKGLNQSLIAKRMNVSRQVINQIDKRKNIDYQFLKDLEAATEIDFTKYIPIPEYLKSSAAHSTNSDVKDFLPSVNIPAKDVAVDKIATLTLIFGIPPASYSNIGGFMKDISALAEKHGIKVL